jgi:hypothetical protein
MRYRTRTGKKLGDQFIVSDFAKGTKQIASRKIPVTTGIITGIIGYFISASAFIIRSFLRVKLGERTFGALTLLSVYFIIWLIYIFPQAYEVTADNLLRSNVDKGNLGVMAMTFFMTFIYAPYKFFENDGSVSSFSPELPYELNIFAIIILFIGVSHFIELLTRKYRKEVVHSYYRGDSVFFGWLVGRKINNYIVKNITIWILIEPLFIVIIAWSISTFLGYNQVAIVLVISAICLFIEEYRGYLENRQFVLDMLDGQLDAGYVKSLQSEYEESLSMKGNLNEANYSVSLGSGASNSERMASGSDSHFRVKLS